MVYYANTNNCGLNHVSSLGDGYSINLSWYKAYPDKQTNRIAYHIYYSCDERFVFYDGPRFVIIDADCLTANIIELTPGQQYWFSVLPVEYDPTTIDYLAELPVSHDNVHYYPSSLLDVDISATDLIVPLRSSTGFPPSGIVKAGIELIQYASIDPTDGYLVVLPASSAANIRLTYATNPANTGDGYIDGYIAVNGMLNQTFNITCVFVQQDIDGYSIPETAKFECISPIAGNPVDGYGNYIVWEANGEVLSNGLLSFSVIDGATSFIVGDSFTITATNISSYTSGGRGFNLTPISMHTVDGYDGTEIRSPSISVTAIEEDNRWGHIYAGQCRFEYPHFAATTLDGYAQVTKDILSTDLSAADAANIGFPEYDYAGYHRTDPVQLLTGKCVGSYIGGQMGCIDGYGNYNIYRGFSLQDRNLQNQEMLLSMTGRPAVLIQRVRTGIICSCYQPSSEYQDDRCVMCGGGKFVLSYQQYYDPRHSDGRLKIRVSNTNESLKMKEAGLESELPFDMWSLTVPTIKTRDIIVLFDQDNNEEFRYEVADVSRSNMLVGLEGLQKFKTFRIRKTDPAYQIRIFRDTSDFPSTFSTTLGFATGLPPHSHVVHVSEKVLTIGQINQTTDVAQGHNHQVVNGVVLPILGHDHTITLATS